MHKCVRTEDRNDWGDLVENNYKYITIQGKCIFKIPIEYIYTYNRNELFLNINFEEVYSKYEIL
jgi:hypothetical protein